MVSSTELGDASIVCEYCLKSFTSGKAYGGHKRIHLHSQQPPTSAAAEIKEEGKEDRKAKKKQTIRCPHCPRFFKSWKSLFGHMRAHPERPWRGINPPPSYLHYNNNNSFDDQIQIKDEDDFELEDFNIVVVPAQVLDLTDSLRGRSWLSCDMRGRKRRVDDADDTNSAVNPNPLLMLAHQAQNHSSSSVSSANNDNNNNNDEKKKKKRKVVVPEESSSRQCVCGICNKEFPSYQALGGHVASHNKKKMEEESSLATKQAAAGCSSADHQCNQCGESFPTGQALGGHKKRHWWTSPNHNNHNNNNNTNPSSSALTNNSKPQTPPPPRVKLEFDLNELPDQTLQD